MFRWSVLFYVTSSWSKTLGALAQEPDHTSLAWKNKVKNYQVKEILKAI